MLADSGCQSDDIYNHLKDKALGKSDGDSLDWANRGGDAHPKGGQHHFMSRARRLNKREKELGTSIRKLFLDFSFHVTRCLKLLLPRLLHSDGLWSQTVNQNKHFLMLPLFSILLQVIVNNEELHSSFCLCLLFFYL